MQSYKPNSGLKYQSLDTLYFYGDKFADRIFKYKHTFKSKTTELNIEIGDSIHLRADYWTMSVKGLNRDGFYEGSLQKKRVLHQNLRFPLYKTEENNIFYKT
jgi:hypothetical protein